jgi:uncharacterized protein
MKPQSFERARQYAEHRLERELSPNLLYHGIVHTREEVVRAAETLARMEGIPEKSFSLLLTAAWFHDIGFIEQALSHELISAQIAVEVLPSFGYRKDEVESVRSAILATALPQSPKNRLEEILADADLDILGSDKFMQRNEDLRHELAYLGKELTDEQWYSGQLKFLEGHKYFTSSARSLRDIQKIRNINQLRKTLELLTQDK